MICGYSAILSLPMLVGAQVLGYGSPASAGMIDGVLEDDILHVPHDRPRAHHNRTLDDLVLNDFTRPLGINSTFYDRGNVEKPPSYDRMVAEEYQIEVLGDSEPQRPQPLRGTTILQPESVDLIFYNFSTAFSEDVHGVVQTARRC
ncbi:hypothetical protein BD626DRAFT_564827 [Schizophyllum amplum]|uniref:Uncharacterized protein n=1 Tax=Schizophyllum amplum TaxID=97359 RepID=A0A550CT28_9AGAR|nr:hypothetical protein BD626DRAFT_564827 [Auriculariopsis ampla]